LYEFVVVEFVGWQIELGKQMCSQPQLKFATDIRHVWEERRIVGLKAAKGGGMKDESIP
jgi:hypothetical protein